MLESNFNNKKNKSSFINLYHGNTNDLEQLCNISAN